MSKIEHYLNECILTEAERRFFLGWCKEGGDEFISILEQMLQEAFLDGLFIKEGSDKSQL